jgi:hypothetical protein
LLHQPHCARRENVIKKIRAGVESEGQIEEQISFEFDQMRLENPKDKRLASFGPAYDDKPVGFVTGWGDPDVHSTVGPDPGQRRIEDPTFLGVARLGRGHGRAAERPHCEQDQPDQGGHKKCSCNVTHGEDLVEPQRQTVSMTPTRYAPDRLTEDGVGDIGHLHGDHRVQRMR